MIGRDAGSKFSGQAAFCTGLLSGDSVMICGWGYCYLWCRKCVVMVFFEDKRCNEVRYFIT